MAFLYTMDFEYDPEKSAANAAKHGLDFDAARAIWDDAAHLVFETPYRAERRFLVIGRIQGRLWTAVATHRGSTIRLISVRRARRSEARAYEDDLGRRI